MSVSQFSHGKSTFQINSRHLSKCMMFTVKNFHLTWGLARRSLSIMYKVIFLPHIFYGFSIWGDASRVKWCVKLLQSAHPSDLLHTGFYRRSYMVALSVGIPSFIAIIGVATFVWLHVILYILLWMFVISANSLFPNFNPLDDDWRWRGRRRLFRT